MGNISYTTKTNTEMFEKHYQGTQPGFLIKGNNDKVTICHFISLVITSSLEVQVNTLNS